MNMMVLGAIVAHTAVALIFDLKTRKIPNAWNALIGSSGVVYHIISRGWDGIAFSIVGGLSIAAVMIILHICGAVGGGDVKWFAALGAWSGIGFASLIFFYSMTFAGVIGLVLIITKSRLFHTLKQWLMSIYLFSLYRNKAHLEELKRSSELEMPLMIAIAPSVAIACWGLVEGGAL